VTAPRATEVWMPTRAQVTVPRAGWAVLAAIILLGLSPRVAFGQG